MIFQLLDEDTLIYDGVLHSNDRTCELHSLTLETHTFDITSKHVLCASVFAGRCNRRFIYFLLIYFLFTVPTVNQNRTRTILSIFLSIHFFLNRSSRKKWTSAAYGGGGGGGGDLGTNGSLQAVFLVTYGLGKGLGFSIKIKRFDYTLWSKGLV